MTAYYGNKKISKVYLGTQNTNCITEIPNDIKLELSNGTLTLKAGSKVYVPNGKTEQKYYKYTYENWTRPNLTATGTLGGSSFAVSAETIYSGYPIHQAVDGNSSTFWLSATGSYASYIFYNPTPLKVTKISTPKQWKDGGIYAIAGDVYGSNDNSSWVKLGSFTGGTYNNGFSCDLSSNKNAYKYHKITPTSTTSNKCWGMSELQITAQAQTGSIESTADDYDYIQGAGQNIFDEVVISSDRTFKSPYNDTRMLFIRHNSNDDTYSERYPVGQCHSGSTAPAGR